MVAMKRSLLICSISLIFSGCIHRADSLQMLEERANYAGKDREQAESLRLGSGQALAEVGANGPLRTAPKVARIWIFPHETPTKEYFWGGWISVVVESDKWNVDRPVEAEPEKSSEPKSRMGGNHAPRK